MCTLRSVTLYYHRDLVVIMGSTETPGRGLIAGKIGKALNAEAIKLCNVVLIQTWLNVLMFLNSAQNRV